MRKGYGALLTGSSSPVSVELGALQDCEARLDKDIIQDEVIRTYPGSIRAARGKT